MWVEQRIGPFKKKEEIFIKFPLLETKDSNYGLKYVRIGIQAPQSPYVTETRPIYYIDPTTKDLNYGNMSGVIYKKANNSQEKKTIYKNSIPVPHNFPRITLPTRTINNYDVNKTHCFSNGILIDSTSHVDKMHEFQIGTSTDSGWPILIGAGEVVEFNDMGFIEYFKIRPLQDEDAYTIIEIQYFDDPT